jgi:hypothetical protein
MLRSGGTQVAAASVPCQHQAALVCCQPSRVMTIIPSSFTSCEAPPEIPPEPQQPVLMRPVAIPSATCQRVPDHRATSTSSVGEGPPLPGHDDPGPGPSHQSPPPPPPRSRLPPPAPQADAGPARGTAIDHHGVASAVRGWFRGSPAMPTPAAALRLKGRLLVYWLGDMEKVC